MSAPSNSIPSDYLRWQKHASDLLVPLEALMKSEHAQLDLAGPPSDHGANADRLEAFARPCLLASFWLHSLRHSKTAEDAQRAEELASWFRRALVQGTDPGQDDYWGPNANYHQNGVEMGLLAIALEIAIEWLWEPLSDSEKEQVALWMASNRGTGHHWNNHFFFGIFALEFLETAGMGRWTDRPAIRHWFDEMELMYRGQGWFMDGMNQTYDHYNAYAFHFYGPFWSHLYGKRDPERVDRWLAWTREFLDSYQHSFAPSGEHPAFGRSITYRFNASAPFAIGHLAGANPLAPGRSRRLCTRNLEFFLNRPIQQEQGALGIGWVDHFPEVAEPYSCAGSVYWCAKAFSALMIPPTDPFWTDEEAPLASEESEFSHPVVPAGLVFRAVEDDVEILNAGSEICAGNRDKFGAFKWGKLAYRTGFAFTLGTKDQTSPDLGLTATDRRSGKTLGRHYTVPLEVGDSLYLSSYNIGDRDVQGNVSVETLVAWKGPWILQVHRYQTYQPTGLALGGYALPVSAGDDVVETDRDGLVSARIGNRMVALQPLGTGLSLSIEGRRDESTRRTHLAAPFHRTPVARIEIPDTSEGVVAVLCLATTAGEPAGAPWEVDTVSGSWRLCHPIFGDWALEHPWLPSLG